MWGWLGGREAVSVEVVVVDEIGVCLLLDKMLL